jgi:hypothetical protein
LFRGEEVSDPLPLGLGLAVPEVADDGLMTSTDRGRENPRAEQTLFV